MNKMKVMTMDETREMNGGWDVCRICGKYVSGGFWTKYNHCAIHAWNAVFPFWDLLDACFNISQ